MINKAHSGEMYTAAESTHKKLGPTILSIANVNQTLSCEDEAEICLISVEKDLLGIWW